MDGELKKMKIEAYKNIDYSESEKVGEFDVMFNPSAYSRKYEIKYDSASGKGTTGSNQKFESDRAPGVQLRVRVRRHGDRRRQKGRHRDHRTPFWNSPPRSTATRNRPNYLKISWGSLISECILKTAEINYNLFKPDGYPLRAKVKATFAENIDDQKRAAEGRQKLSGPDPLPGRDRWRHAASHGVPHLRRFLVLSGSRQGQRSYKFQKAEHGRYPAVFRPSSNGRVERKS